MNGKAFIDTNVLVYAHDASEPRKQDAALATLDRLVSGRAGLVSAQVLSEFLVATTRKLALPIDVASAAGQVARFASVWPVLPVDGLVVREAVQGHLRYGMHYWDALVWAAARLSGCRLVLTEDIQASEIEGVAFVDPFGDDFDLDRVLA